MLTSAAIPRGADRHDHRSPNLDFGMHVCAIYRNKAEQFSPLTSFFAEGFNNREKCLYIVDENTPEDIRSRLYVTYAHAGNPSQPAYLDVLTSDATYIKDGEFDTEVMIERLREMVATSTDSGYSGVRATAEMSWAITSATPIEKLLEYESKLNPFYPTQKLIGICQYNEEKFPPEFLIEMIRRHPYLIMYGKLYENKYFYTDPYYQSSVSAPIQADDYETVVSVICDETPIA